MPAVWSERITDFPVENSQRIDSDAYFLHADKRTVEILKRTTLVQK